MNAATPPAPHGVALYLGVVQFFFALTWSALLAVAAFARMAVVTGRLPQQPHLAGLVAWAPVGAWILAAVLLAAAAGRRATAAAS